MDTPHKGGGCEKPRRVSHRAGLQVLYHNRCCLSKTDPKGSPAFSSLTHILAFAGDGFAHVVLDTHTETPNLILPMRARPVSGALHPNPPGTHRSCQPTVIARSRARGSPGHGQGCCLLLRGLQLETNAIPLAHQNFKSISMTSAYFL